MKFIAQINKGQPDFRSDYNHQRFKRFMRENEGQLIEIAPVMKTRSLAQNNYYWGVLVPTFADYHKISEDDAHELLKLEFNFAFIPIGKTQVKIGRSTANLRVGEFVEYCMRIEAWFNENQIYLPPRNSYKIAPLNK